MSASLIGRLGSSAFRLSNIALIERCLLWVISCRDSRRPARPLWAKTGPRVQRRKSAAAACSFLITRSDATFGPAVIGRALAEPGKALMVEPQIRYDDGAGYERYMGYWSQLAGETFLDWLAPPPGLRWIDIGCGTGAFTELLVKRCAPAVVQETYRKDLIGHAM
jgi:hypothetical protein